MRHEWERSGRSKHLITPLLLPFPLLVLLRPFPESLPTCAQWAFSCGQKSAGCPFPNPALTPVPTPWPFSSPGLSSYSLYDSTARFNHRVPFTLPGVSQSSLSHTFLDHRNQRQEKLLIPPSWPTSWDLEFGHTKAWQRPPEDQGGLISLEIK